MASPPTFQLFTSLRYDPILLESTENSRQDLNFITPSPFYMLAYHRDRMVEAAQHFDFSLVTSKLSDGGSLHSLLLMLVQEWQKGEGKADGPLKLRILFDKLANMTVDFLPIPSVPLTTLYPISFGPPNTAPQEHPAKKKEFNPSPLTGGALSLGPTDFLPTAGSSPSSSLPQSQILKPSSLTDGALSLDHTDSHPTSNKEPAPTSHGQPPEWKLKVDTAPTPSNQFTLLKTTERDMYDESRARALPSNPASAVHREVILFNSVREVTEGTLTSLYFHRGGRWVTPPVGVPSAYALLNTGSEASCSPQPPLSVMQAHGEEADASGHREHSQNRDEGELRKPFPGRWGHSVRSAKVGAGGQRGTSRRWALGKGFCMEETVDVSTIEAGEGVWVSNGVRGFGWGRVVV